MQHLNTEATANMKIMKALYEFSKGCVVSTEEFKQYEIIILSDEEHVGDAYLNEELPEFQLIMNHEGLIVVYSQHFPLDTDFELKFDTERTSFGLYTNPSELVGVQEAESTCELQILMTPDGQLQINSPHVPLNSNVRVTFDENNVSLSVYVESPLHLDSDSDSEPDSDSEDNTVFYPSEDQMSIAEEEEPEPNSVIMTHQEISASLREIVIGCRTLYTPSCANMNRDQFSNHLANIKNQMRACCERTGSAILPFNFDFMTAQEHADSFAVMRASLTEALPYL